MKEEPNTIGNFKKKDFGMHHPPCFGNMDGNAGYRAEDG